MRRKHMLRAAAALILVAFAAFPSVRADQPATAPTTTAPAETPAEDRTSLVVAEAVKAMQAGRFDAAAAKCSQELARLAGDADLAEAEPFVNVAFTLRLARHLGRLGSDSQRQELLAYLLANEDLARAVAFLVRDDQEEPKGVYELLDSLRGQFPDKLAKWVNLAAAVCVVHDTPLKRHINENEVSAPKAPEIFSYFSANARRMLFDLQAVPPELLIYVVDTTASIPEMKWALSRYKGERKVGRHYFNISYDMDHFRRGTKKRVTVKGFNLPNILKFGGVCVDQAYFAAAIGKAIGVPTCLLSGRGSEVGHAWVGFFQAQRGGALWNMDYGRFGQYCVVRGTVIDPQTRQNIGDDYLSVQAELIGASRDDRYAAIAMIDAARCLRQASPDALSRQLDLIEAGLKRARGYTPGWLLVGELTAAGDMTYQQKRYWADNLLKMCGKKYPDFALAVLRPMIHTVSETDRQNSLWNACFELFGSRSDLAAEIRFAQAEMWDEAGDARKSGQCYADIVNRYVNAGPFAIEALKRTEHKLRDLGRDNRVVPMYASAWAKCNKPRNVAPEFLGRANWVRIALLYARALESARQDDRAARVRAEVESVTGRKVNF